jgi:hypothetical protein
MPDTRFWNLAGALAALCACTLALPSAAAAAAAAAEDEKAPPPLPERRLYLTDLTLLRVNPMGLETQLRLGYQHRLYDADSLALRDNFVYGGTFVRLSPAAVRTAGVFEAQPVSVLNLRFTMEYLRYFGTAGYLQSAPTADVDFSDSALADAEESAYSTGGLHATFEPLLQVKFGQVAVRSRALLGWFDMDLRAGDRVWYEATLDAPLPGNGFTLANDLDVVYLTDFGLTAGVRYSSVFPQYSAAQSRKETDTSHHRVGVLAAYTFFDEGYTAFNKPTAILITSWYLKHRYRTGQDVPRAVPYVIAGFAFTSDLLDAR